MREGWGLGEGRVPGESTALRGSALPSSWCPELPYSSLPGEPQILGFVNHRPILTVLINLVVSHLRVAKMVQDTQKPSICLCGPWSLDGQRGAIRL